jgi:WD40 repeat protein
MSRLTFCLLGVATPADLISETRMSPFNVGRRIAITDFTEAEAAPLAAMLPGGQGTLHRVLWWTGGNPYMTQRLCEAVARSGSGDRVDAICESLFLTKSAQDSDDNLAFVRNRLLRSEADLASLLDLYRKISEGKRVPDDETNPLCGVLKLSGVVKESEGLLKVRNRIYDRVFDREWVAAHMPDAELRRQRTAYRRGVARALSLSTLVLLIVSALAIAATRSERKANRNAAAAKRSREQEAVLREVAEQRLYVANINLAQRAWESGVLQRTRELLQQCVPAPGRQDYRGFEWYYLARLAKGDSIADLPDAPKRINDLSMSAAGDHITACGEDGRVIVWDAASRRTICKLDTGKVPAQLVHILPDGRSLHLLLKTGQIQRWDIISGKFLANLASIPVDQVPRATVFSRDGARIAILYRGRSLRIFDVRSGEQLDNTLVRGIPSQNLIFMADGNRLIFGGVGVITIRDLARHQEVMTLRSHIDQIYCFALSADERQLATGSIDNTARIWDLATGREQFRAEGHADAVTGVALLDSGRTLVTASGDSTVRVWDVAARRRTATLRGSPGGILMLAAGLDNQNFVTTDRFNGVNLWRADFRQQPSVAVRMPDAVASLAISPNVSLLAAATWMSGATIVDVAARRRIAVLPSHGLPVTAVCFSPDEKLLATGDGLFIHAGVVRVWDIRSRNLLASLRGHTEPVRAAAFSPDGRLLVSASLDQSLRIWRLADGTCIQTKNVPNQLTCLSFSPDGKLLAAAGLNRGGTSSTIWIWKYPSMALLASMDGHWFGAGKHRPMGHCQPQSSRNDE